MNPMTHWRFSQKPVRFICVDYRASFLLLGFIMHCRLWTLSLCLIGTFVLALLEYQGMTLPMALSRGRHLIATFGLNGIRPGCDRSKSRRFFEGSR